MANTQLISNIAQIMGNRGVQQGAPAPADPRQQTMLQQLGITNPLLQQFGQQVGNLMGVDTRSAMQQTNAAIAAVKDPSTYQGQLEIAKAIMNVDPMKGAELLAAAEEKRRAQLAAQQRREALQRQATSLGLTSTADMLANNGDMKEAADQIREEEKRQAINRGGRPARLAVAKTAGLPAEAINDIRNGKYDTMDNDQFNDWVSGNEASLAAYSSANDPTPKAYKVNDYGQVYDDASGQWVNPSQLGLQQAVTVTKQLSGADSVSSKLTDGAVTSFLELNGLAQDAVKILEVNQISEDLMKNGIITGFGAEFQTDALRLGQQLGILPPEMTDKLAASQAFFATRGRAVAEVIKAFGAGTGLSDADREYAQKIAAGEIGLTEESVSRLLRIERQVATRAIEKNNTALGRLNSLGNLDQAIYDSYLIVPPERDATAPDLSDTAKKYL